MRALCLFRQVFPASQSRPGRESARVRPVAEGEKQGITGAYDTHGTMCRDFSGLMGGDRPHMWLHCLQDRARSGGQRCAVSARAFRPVV